MLGWVITCHDEEAQEMLLKLEARFGPLAQCATRCMKPTQVMA